MNLNLKNNVSYFQIPVELQLLAQLSSSIIEDCCCSESELFGQFTDNVWIRGSIGGFGDAVSHKLRVIDKKLRLLKIRFVHYGNTGCGGSSPGVQSRKIFA